MRSHAFHLSLPPHHLDDQGLPYVTKYAHQKARKLVQNVLSIQLSEDLFCQSNNGETTNDDVAEEDDDDEFEEDEDINPHSFGSHHRETLNSLTKKCSRLLSQFSTLDNLKHGGIQQTELCQMILHMLRLVSCTITRHDDDDSVSLHYENVGYLYQTPKDDVQNPPQALPNSTQQLADELHQDFALPSPAREVLLSLIVNLLSNKGPLRSVSNASLYDDDDDQNKPRFLMILHWKVLLRMLLRTAPYLDEHEASKIPVDSSSRGSTTLKRTVQLIRDARHFFDQGVRPPNSQNADTTTQTLPVVLDQTARQIWDMVQTDALFHSHTHACYRATIILYLFSPSRCSAAFYQQVLPQWWESWTNIDRCPEFDFLWLALFCRARKYCAADTFDWTPIRKRLLTNSQYWLQLPIGGSSLDKSFPRAPNPRSRSCPPRLKVFVGASSSYEEGIDFVAKVTKLLVAGLGTGSEVSGMSQGTADVCRFLSFVTPYFNPSNLGSWTFTLGAFLHYFCYEFTCRVGAAAGIDALRQSHPALAQELSRVQPGPAARPIPPHEVVALLHALLPLCQQALYSKNGHVGRAGEAAMLYLIQMDPAHTTPAFLDFACRALDISAVNLSHQAPSALSALTRLVQPALRGNSLLVRLPEMLRLSLAGIDSNDQNKTLRTLILYRSLASWVPVGGRPEDWPTLDTSDASAVGPDGTMRVGKRLSESIEKTRTLPGYLEAIEKLPETSLLRQGIASNGDNDEMRQLIVTEAMSAMSDWALEFLDRVFGLLRASGEREKTGKTASGVANRHSSADVHAARNFSRVLKECLVQVFAAMDDEVHALAVRTVCRFLEDETHPSAAKDTSFLCQAVAAARENSKGEVSSPGLDSLILILADDLPHHSTKTVVYRLRCLAGAVRLSGPGIVTHRKTVAASIKFALASDDRHLFKTGCKLLRHTLSTLSESYPLSSDSRPRAFAQDSSISLGRSAQLHGDEVKWHVPDKACVEFASELLDSHVLKKLDRLYESISGDESESRSRMLNSLDVQDLRRFLRIIRYSIRGGASILLDQVEGVLPDKDIVPYEMANRRLLATAGGEVEASIMSVRMRLASFLVVLSAVVASDTLYPESMLNISEDEAYRKSLPSIASDPKVCKETCDIALLLLTRRGASFRSQEARTIWKAQKQLATDFCLSAQVDQMSETLQSAAAYGEGTAVLYKDGEDAGKTVPRRLLVARILLFHDSLQRNASFEVPRRLRRLNRELKSPRNILFSVKETLPEMLGYLESLLPSQAPLPLDAYEGITDGLCALCCHSNTQVRASAISVTDYAMTRFAWLLAPRVPRLLSAVALEDKDMNGKFGFPACANLLEKVNQQGKRKRLAEAVKGVCSILSLPRSIKHLMGTEKMRLRFARTICGTDSLISLLPAEEVQKIVHYLQAVFSPFRSKLYHLPRVTQVDKQSHLDILSFTNDILAEKTIETNDNSESVAVHWRKLLLGCWFLLSQIDGAKGDEALQEKVQRSWMTCFLILENESGQPLQRVGLGLFGRLTLLSGKGMSPLEDKMKTESFCRVLGDALVFDHREDTRIGGGHGAQWSAGVEEIIRDSSRNIAPRTLFPFQRTSQSLGSFKASHSQLIESVLASVSRETADKAVGYLLAETKGMAAAPPNEDQRNQQITSAEIFGGICGYFIRHSGIDVSAVWKLTLLPHLEDVMSKIPFSLSSAYFDAIRYSIQFAAPKHFFALTEWLVDRVETTLWQPQSCRDEATEVESSKDSSSPSNHGTDQGFTTQSKWLYLFSAVLIEMDDSEVDGAMARSSWYTSQLVEDCSMDLETPNSELEISWNLVIKRLLPRLTAALGHPFDSCRDHISRCLFRICYCHRKRSRLNASRAPSRSSSMVSLTSMEEAAVVEHNPGYGVVETLATLERSEGWSFHDRYNALSTARRFMSYCVHLGEAKFEFSEFVIPLLPVAFAALKSTVEDEIADSTNEEDAAKRALEAEVIKAFRYMIAEVSVTAAISYGRDMDITRVLDTVDTARHNEKWQVRHACANFLRCFQGAHKFLFSDAHADRTMAIVAELLADERREVSSAAMAALTGILAASPEADVSRFVKKYSVLASKSKMKRQKKGAVAKTLSADEDEARQEKAGRRAKNQQTSVFFLCAAIMSHPYDTPSFVPAALASISKHSFERNAPLGVRDIVKKCCAEYKKTHMSDNWELHRQAFTQEQLEALEDVVSSPHYYA